VIELSTDSPQVQAQKLAAEANEKVKELCRRSYQKGLNEGYASGFKAGVDAVMNTKATPSETLYTKLN
jgi:flagellar biosynthesis/type III secretory pathway protein FliH